MNCHEVRHLIAAHADGEADWSQSRAIDSHLRNCADCTAARASLFALRAQLRTEVPYHGVPPALRARLAAAAADMAAVRVRRTDPLRQHWRWLAGGAVAGGIATAFAWVVGTAVLAVHAADEFAQEVVASHVRATLGDHLLQVASSDQHTVKPWLSARLDYSPPVRDLAAEGFPLTGARIDMLGQRRVATLVYGHRLHTIDVFVRPGSGHAAPPAAQTVRGFNVARAIGAGMEWTAVSDVDAGALSAFVARLARSD
jgi:anti-sigma factor RsiW